MGIFHHNRNKDAKDPPAHEEKGAAAHADDKPGDKKPVAAEADAAHADAEKKPETEQQNGVLPPAPADLKGQLGKFKAAADKAAANKAARKAAMSAEAGEDEQGEDDDRAHPRQDNKEWWKTIIKTGLGILGGVLGWIGGGGLFGGIIAFGLSLFLGNSVTDWIVDKMNLGGTPAPGGNTAPPPPQKESHAPAQGAGTPAPNKAQEEAKADAKAAEEAKKQEEAKKLADAEKQKNSGVTGGQSTNSPAAPAPTPCRDPQGKEVACLAH